MKRKGKGKGKSKSPQSWKGKGKGKGKGESKSPQSRSERNVESDPPAQAGAPDQSNSGAVSSTSHWYHGGQEVRPSLATSDSD